MPARRLQMVRGALRAQLANDDVSWPRASPRTFDGMQHRRGREARLVGCRRIAGGNHARWEHRFGWFGHHRWRRVAARGRGRHSRAGELPGLSLPIRSSGRAFRQMHPACSVTLIGSRPDLSACSSHRFPRPRVPARSFQPIGCGRGFAFRLPAICSKSESRRRSRRALSLPTRRLHRGQSRETSGRTQR